MEKLNMAPLPEEEITADKAAIEGKPQLLLDKVRQKFEVFGGISVLFGVLFTLFFYDAGIGVNVFLFGLSTVLLMLLIINRLSLSVKTGTKACYLGVLLLGISTGYTANGALQFLNVVGILLLLDLSLLHQFYEDRKWSFMEHGRRILSLPLYSIASLGLPFVDGGRFLKQRKIVKNEQTRNILIGFLIALPLLLLIMALLSQADLLFGELTGGFFRKIFSGDLFFIILMTLFGFLASYCVLCGTLYREGAAEAKQAGKADASIAVTFMILLCLVYAFFCGIQIVYLFAGGLFTLPDGFTFAEYARRGFFELLAVTVINIAILFICMTRFKESRLLFWLTVFMTACTYIMIASAAYRMILYIMAYHLTFLRLFVLLTLFINALILVGLIIFARNKDFPLFRYFVAVVTICYLAFTFIKPDYISAAYLASNKEKMDISDMYYLTQELSFDAAPVVLKLLDEPQRWGDEVYAEVYQECKENYYNRIASQQDSQIRSFNYSNHMAVVYAAKQSR